MKNPLILCFVAVLCFWGCESSQEQQYRAQLEAEHNYLELQHQTETENILSRDPNFREALHKRVSTETTTCYIYPRYVYQPILLTPEQSTGPSSNEILSEWILWQKEYQARQRQKQMDLYMLNMMNSLSGIDSSLDQLRWQNQMNSIFGQ